MRATTWSRFSCALVLLACGAVALACGSSETAERPSGKSGAGGTSARGGGSGAGGGPPVTITTGSGGAGASGGTGATGGSGGSGGPGGSSGAGGGKGCAYATVKSDLLPANILVVLDRSGSMNCNLPPVTDSATCEKNPVQVDPSKPNKWTVVKQALKDAFAALPPTTSVGLSYFNTDDECGANSMPSVPVRLLDAAHMAGLAANLDGARAPQGGTPIIGSTILAYKHLHQQAQVAGNKFVLLLTDGAETCNAAQIDVLSTEIPKAVSVNIRTFVIGAPGSEAARSMLSEMAHLGGTAQSPSCNHGGTSPDVGDCHFDMTTSQNLSADLAAALKRISGAALSCEFDVPTGESVDLNRVNVHYTQGGTGPGIDIPQDKNSDCQAGAEGWQYSTDYRKIILCGKICDEVKADTSAKIDIVLGCATIVK